MSTNRWMSFLGIAYRAGKIVTGEELVVKEIQKQRVKLVLLANDASPNTLKKVSDKCNSYEVPLQIVQDRYSLGNSIGKTARVVVAITDEGIATKLLTLLE